MPRRKAKSSSKPFHRPGSKYFYIKYKNADGKWVGPVSTQTTDYDEACEILRSIQEAIANPNAVVLPRVPARAKPLTVREAANRWLIERKALGQANYTTEESHVRIHIVPGLGHYQLQDVRPRHAREFVKILKAKKKRQKSRETDELLAPRTVRKIYGTAHKMFEDFVTDELIPSNPMRLKEHDLPPNVDQDPEWRDGAVFTANEVEALISSPKIPVVRRMYYALEFLTGDRHGETAALRFHHIRSDSPLSRLVVARSYNARTKTNATRKIPIHPTLAAMLAEWKLTGFEEWAGRQWTPGDFIIPGLRDKRRRGEADSGDPEVMYSRHIAYKRLVNVDLPALGLRHRRNYDSRRTFISIARSHGARPDVLKWITHPPSKTVFDLYTTFDWATLCEAVLCIRIERRPPLAVVGAE